jgi:hypothetical protein
VKNLLVGPVTGASNSGAAAAGASGAGASRSGDVGG